MKKAILVLSAVVTCCLARSSQCDAGAYAYVADDGNSKVYAIQVSNQIVSDIVVGDAFSGSAFFGVAITPEGEVYVANPGANAVYVYGEVLYTIEDIGEKPVGVAASPDGDYVYVTNRGDDNVSVIDTLTRTEVTEPSTRIPVQNAPIGVAVSPDGLHIYVANRGSNSVSVIGASDGEVLDTIEDIGEKPVGVAVSPDGSYVYITNLGEGTVSVINTSTWEEVTGFYTRPRVGADPIGVAVSPDGSLAYVASRGSGSVFVIDTSDTSDFKVVDTIENVGKKPVGVALTPNGDYLYVTNRGGSTSNGTVSVIRASDRQLVDIIEDAWEKPASFGQFLGSVSTPEAPSNLTPTTESDSQINLSWTDNSFDESGFKIERKMVSQEGGETESEGMYADVATVDTNVTSYSDTGLEPDTAYSYRVSAYNHHGDSDYSDETEAKTAPIPTLKAPSNLTAADVSHSRIELSWTDNSFGESGVEIWRKEVSEETDSETDAEDSDETDSETDVSGTFTKIAELGANVTKYSDGGLEPYSTYQYRVRAYNDAGNFSDYSNTAEARTDDDCFIATAAYGSLIEPQVVILRNFRDSYLIPYSLGRVLVKTYYAYSPPIANFISKHDTLCAAVRVGLMPLVAISYSTLHFGPAITFTMLMVLLAIPIVLVSCDRRKATGYRANS